MATRLIFPLTARYLFSYHGSGRWRWRHNAPGPGSNVKRSTFRPAWQIRHNLNQQKVSPGPPPPLRDVKNEDRPGRLYENKGSIDKISELITDILAKIRSFLQIFSNFEAQFTGNCAFPTACLREFAALNHPFPDSRPHPVPLLWRLCHTQRPAGAGTGKSVRGRRQAPFPKFRSNSSAHERNTGRPSKIS